jgi:MFS family permease
MEPPIMPVEPPSSAAQTVERVTPRRRIIDREAALTMLLCAMFALLYLDRINVSAAAPSMSREFGLSNTALGVAFSAFSWSYLGSVLIGAFAADRFGARGVLLGCALVVGLATIATGLVGGIAGLFLARFLVGAGEGPAFPAATQVMRDWFRADRFGYIQGITHSASRLGGALAPPLVAWVTILSSWRVSFLVCGALALIWGAAWWRYFRNAPASHEAAASRHASFPESPGLAAERHPSLGLLTRRMAIVTFVMFTYGWSYWIFLSWLPLYFSSRYGTDLKSSALLASAPLLSGVLGNALGGIISDYVLRRTGRPRLARCGVVFVSLLGSALFLCLSLFSRDLVVIVPLLALSMLFLEMTIAPMYAVPMDMSRTRAGIGSAYVIMGVGIAGILSPLVFGRLIDLTGSWDIPFAIAVLILLSGAVAVLFVRPDRPLASEQ